MMRIGINARFLIHGELEGIGRYTYEITKRLAALFPNDELYLFFDRKYTTEFLLAENCIPIIVYPSARHPLLWKLWFDYSLPLYLKKHKIDVLFSPDGFVSLRTYVPQILTIHDIAFEHHPEWIPNAHYNYLHQNTPKFIAKAKHLITVSKFSKNDIENYYQLPKDAVLFSYNGIGTMDVQKIDLSIYRLLPKEYFIFIGAVHPRKNILQLIQAFEYFKQNYNTNFKLVIIGRDAWLNKTLHHHLNNSKYKNDIIWIPTMERSKVLYLLQQAYAMLYLSLFEGFGMPLTEAMYYGIPIIAANNSALPEIAQHAALYVNENNSEEIVDAMYQLVTDNVVYSELQQAGSQQLHRFNWDTTASLIANLISRYQ